MSSDILTYVAVGIFGTLIAIVAGLAIVLRPRVALMVLFALMLLCEHYPQTDPNGNLVVTFLPALYDNFNITLGIPALKFNPIEVLLVFIFIGHVLQRLSRPHGAFRLGAVTIFGSIYFLWMVVSIVWGVVNQGNWKVALWILRPVFYFLLVSYLATHLLRRRRDCAVAVGILVVMCLVKAFQLIFRHGLSGAPAGTVEAYAAHEETSFALYAAWFTIATFFLRYPPRYRNLLWAVFPIILLAIAWNERRVNYATFMIGIGIMFLLTSPQTIRRRLLILQIGVALAFIYVAFGWFGPTNALTSPIKGLKQGVHAELLKEDTDRSSFYRKAERYNLRHTIRANPIMGTGLGVRYLQLITLDKLNFGYAVYITHNQVLLVHSATGTIGYFIFLTFFVSLVAQLTIYWRLLEVPWQRATALCAVLSVTNWLVVGYYDLQLFFFRNSIVMGVIVAIPTALYRMKYLPRPLPRQIKKKPYAPPALNPA
ncbi:MAG: O-antigen ligase family protein [bacterium]|nr:O-antigen ligase family protein [Candidatus Sumerlaeota bacterium]